MTESTDKGKTGKTAIPILYKNIKLERFKTSYKDYLDGKVWFADKETLNDPMESVPLSDRFFVRDLKRRYREERRDFERRREEQAELYQKRKQQLDDIKICSLMEKTDIFAMWSHYADEHRGVCIGFKIVHGELK